MSDKTNSIDEKEENVHTDSQMEQSPAKETQNFAEVSSSKQNPNIGRNIQIPIANPFTNSSNQLPLWVAGNPWIYYVNDYTNLGSSPSKFIALEDLIQMDSNLEKMAIVHEIAVDPEFNVEDFQRKDKVYEVVKSNFHKAFWDLLREDFAKTPPCYENAFKCLNDLREVGEYTHNRFLMLLFLIFSWFLIISASRISPTRWQP